MRQNLPLILHDSLTEKRKVDVRVIEKVKSNIFFKVLRDKPLTLVQKGESMTTCRETLFEKIKAVQARNYSLPRKKAEVFRLLRPIMRGMKAERANRLL